MSPLLESILWSSSTAVRHVDALAILGLRGAACKGVGFRIQTHLFRGVKFGEFWVSDSLQGPVHNKSMHVAWHVNPKSQNKARD